MRRCRSISETHRTHCVPPQCARRAAAGGGALLRPYTMLHMIISNARQVCTSSSMHHLISYCSSLDPPRGRFSLLIKCRRDIALNAHAIKGNREAVQRSDIDDLDQLLAGSWPLWTLCILLLHQLPMHKVKPFKSGEMW